MIRFLVGTVMLVATSVTHAASFNTLSALTQDQFKQLSENIAAAAQYKGITPPEPLGIIGFDIGLSLSHTGIEVDSVFDAASEGDFDVSGLVLPRLTVHKGLPLGIDIGASATGAPGTDIKILGAEIRYALLDGGVATPAVGIRASGSVIQGVDEMDMTNIGLDISASKGLLMFTPYIGAGVLRTTATPNDAGTLEEETLSQTKVFAGLNVNLGINFTLEADKTGDYTSYSAKAGFRF